ncbi:MAG: MBL fold metallo-hydrolase, partial [Candidatus Eremiobacteraeota bacterium]|nr:MBL fold metallo-hydrolase [Candidatus Eremiobacteraeota bacterium]
SSFADEGAGDFLNTVFDIKAYDPAGELKFGRAKITFAPTRHYIPTFSLRYANNGTVISYSADTAPNQEVCQLARDAALFICEATLLPEEVEHGMRGHSSALEAGEMAKAAGAQRLMLTHYPSEASQEELILHARAVYHGQIIVADDHARISL